MQKSIYELILAYASPLSQEVNHTDDGISMIAKKFQIEFSSNEISIMNHNDQNVITIYTSLGSVKNYESALRISDLHGANNRKVEFGGLNAHRDAFKFVKNFSA